MSQLHKHISLKVRIFYLWIMDKISDAVWQCMEFDRVLWWHFLTHWKSRPLPWIFFWWCYSYGPQQGPDRQQKKRGRAQAEEKARGSCSRRPRTRERKGNQEKEKDLSRVQSLGSAGQKTQKKTRRMEGQNLECWCCRWCHSHPKVRLQWLQWGVTFSQVVWLIGCWLVSASHK